MKSTPPLALAVFLACCAAPNDRREEHTGTVQPAPPPATSVTTLQEPPPHAGHADAPVVPVGSTKPGEPIPSAREVMERARRSGVPERHIAWTEVRDMIVRGNVLVVEYGGFSPDAKMWMIDGRVYVTQVPAAVIGSAVRLGGERWKIAELLVD